MPEPRPVVGRFKRIASRARTLAIVYFLLLFVGTHLPPGPPSGVAVNDKLLHFGGYFSLTLVVLVAWDLTVGHLQPKHYFAVWLAGTVYGAFDELTQIPVGRTCDVNDWVADVLGIVSGLIVFRVGRAAVTRVLAWSGAVSVGEP